MAHDTHDDSIYLLAERVDLLDERVDDTAVDEEEEEEDDEEEEEEAIDSDTMTRGRSRRTALMSRPDSAGKSGVKSTWPRRRSVATWRSC